MRKRTKSILALFVALVLCAGLLAACNDGNADPTRYTLTVTNGTGSGTFDEGKQVTATATIPSGKEFVAWFEGETQVSTANPYIFTITKNITLTATFKDAGTTTQHTLTVTNGTGGGTFDEGTQVTATATVPSGKEFVAWFEGTTQVSTANPYIFTLTKTLTLTATFKDVQAPDINDGTTVEKAIVAITNSPAVACAFSGSPVWIKMNVAADVNYEYTVGAFTDYSVIAACTGFTIDLWTDLPEGEPDVQINASSNPYVDTFSMPSAFTGYMRVTPIGVTSAIIKAFIFDLPEVYDFSGVVFGNAEPTDGKATVSGFWNDANSEFNSDAFTNWRRRGESKQVGLQFGNTINRFSTGIQTKSGSGDATKYASAYSDGSGSYRAKSSDGNFYDVSYNDFMIGNIYESSADYLAAIKSSVSSLFWGESAMIYNAQTFQKGVYDGKDLYKLTFVNEEAYNFDSDRQAYRRVANVYVLDGKVVMYDDTSDYYRSFEDIGGVPVYTSYEKSYVVRNYTGGVTLPTGWESKVSAAPGKSHPKAIEVAANGTEGSCAYDGTAVWFKVPLVANVEYNLVITVYDAMGGAVSTTCNGITATRYNSYVSSDGSFTSNAATLTGKLKYTSDMTGYLKITLSGVTNALVKITVAPAG